MSSKDLLLNVYKFINDWQLKYDKGFKPIPIDNHFLLIFNHKNQIVSFTFSNKNLRDLCKDDIPLDLLSEYDYLSEDDNKIIFYKL